MANKNISKIILAIQKHNVILQEVIDIFDSYEGRPLTRDILNELEVEVVMHINAYYNDERYDNEILNFVLKSFYENIFSKLKQQLDRI